ncbi:MAG: helix-hairpin-helix domain-containing protein [Candidatus Delongbacteria bacterium]
MMKKEKSRTDRIYHRTYNGSLFLLIVLSVILFCKTSTCTDNDIDSIGLITGEETNNTLEKDQKSAAVKSDIEQKASDSKTTNNDTQKNIIKELTVSKNILNINNASAEELVKLKGIGVKTAGKIIKYRKEFGRFKAAEELMNVKGIGEKKFSAIRDLIEI